MQLSVAGRGLSYSRLIRGSVGERLNRVSGGMRRRRVRRRLGADPTRAIRWPVDAIEVAEALLEPLSRQDANYHDVWASVAAAPLAELLYAASQQPGGGRGIEWAWRAAVNVDADKRVPGWRQAAHVCDQAGAPFQGDLLKIAQWEPRLRDSVARTMCGALTPWIAKEPGRGGTGARRRV